MRDTGGRRAVERSRTRRIAGALALAVACVLLFAACIPRPPGDFYDAPVPLHGDRPGAVIWAEPLPVTTGANAEAWRVMYHSRDSQNRDVAVTGTIYYPTDPAPPGGWPVVSYAHGTAGMASQCAPSRNGASTGSFGVRGIVVATDYMGLGPTGQRHAFLSGAAEGHSVIDIVRAVRQFPGAHASRHWVTVGVSQGGHASLFAGQLARAYAPELHLDGVVADAPGSGLLDTYPGDSQLVVDVITVMALYGIAVDHPQIHPEDYVTPRTAEAAKALDTGCLTETAIALAGIPHADLFTADPRTTSPAREAALENSPGGSPIGAPVLLVQGTADTTVVPARTDALLEKLCRCRKPIQLLTVPGGTHDNTPSLAKAEIATWLNDRLAGVHAPTSCS